MSAEGGQRASRNRIQTDVAASIPEYAACAVRRSGDLDLAVSAAEAALVHPRAVPERRETFRLGRSAAHAALDMLGRDVGVIGVGANREPLWPPGVVGSISHVAGLARAVVAPATKSDGVGVDIEVRRSAPELELQVPRSEERQWLDGVAGAERDAMLLSLFSAKEAVFKAFFPRVGFFFGFEAALLVPTSSGFAGSLVQAIDSEYPSARRFNIACRWYGSMVATWLVLPKTDSIAD